MPRPKNTTHKWKHNDNPMETKKRRRMEIFQQRTTEAKNRRPIKLQPDGKINKMHTGKNNRQNTKKQTKPGKRNRNNKSPKKRPEGEMKRSQHCNKEKQKQTWEHESLHTKPGQIKGSNRKRTHKKPSQKNQQGSRNKITTFLERKKENNTQTE